MLGQERLNSVGDLSIVRKADSWGEGEELALLAERAGRAKLYKANQPGLCMELPSGRSWCGRCSGETAGESG